jgi:hypothetical protein
MACLPGLSAKIRSISSELRIDEEVQLMERVQPGVGEFYQLLLPLVGFLLLLLVRHLSA